MTTEAAAAFAHQWVAAWNSHDLERILVLYSEDFTIESPLAATLLPDTQGVVQGKAAVRKYWQLGLERAPHLHFELLEVLTGARSVRLRLLNRTAGRTSLEVMSFDGDGKVRATVVIYAPGGNMHGPAGDQMH